MYDERIMSLSRQAYDMIPRMEIGDIVYIDDDDKLHVGDRVPRYCQVVASYPNKKSSPVMSLDDVADAIHTWLMRLPLRSNGDKLAYYDEFGDEICRDCADRYDNPPSRPTEPGERIICQYCRCVI